MSRLDKIEAQGIKDAAMQLDRLIAEAPENLSGQRLIQAIGNVLCDHTNNPPQPGEAFLWALATLAIARLIEDKRSAERGEKELSI